MRSPRLALVALAAAAGCSSNDKHGPEAPVLTLAVSDPSEVKLTWTAPAGAVSGIRVEGALGSGPFEEIGAAPPEAVGVVIQLAPDAPELVDLRFRVRFLVSVLGSAPTAGPPSNEVVHQLPLRPPEGLQAWPGTGGVQIGWTNRSAAADSLLLERRVLDAGGVAGAWSEIPVPFPSTQLLDADLSAWEDGARYGYRLRARKGAALSAPAEAETYAAPLLAPADVAATPLDGGVLLRWTNRSRHATGLHVRRTAPGSEVVRFLPATESSLVDTGLPPGRYAYEIVATAAAPAVMESSPVRAEAVTLLPAAWGPLVPSMVRLPGGEAAAATDAGWLVAGGLGNPGQGTARLQAPGASGYAAHDLVPGSVLMRPGALVDPQGRPHLVYVDGPLGWGPPRGIVHEWLEGGAWRHEVVAQRPFSAGDATQVVRAAVAGDGAIHLAWMAGPDPALGLEYATNRSGTWAVEGVTAALPAGLRVRFSRFWIAADADGTAHLLLNNWGELSYAVRGVSGWRVEPVPTGQVHADYDDGALGALLADGPPLIAYTHVDPVTFAGDVRAISRGTSGWGAPEILATSTAFGISIRAARTAGGARAALAIGGTGARVWVGAPGAWAEWRILPTDDFFEVGLTPAGKAWLLDGLTPTYSTAETVSCVLYQEP